MDLRCPIVVAAPEAEGEQGDAGHGLPEEDMKDRQMVGVEKVLSISHPLPPLLACSAWAAHLISCTSVPFQEALMPRVQPWLCRLILTLGPKAPLTSRLLKKARVSAEVAWVLGMLGWSPARFVEQVS